MSSKTFGAVVGVIITLAIAMFLGLYMLGSPGQGRVEQRAAYYEYADEPDYTDDGSYYYDEFDATYPTQ